MTIVRAESSKDIEAIRNVLRACFATDCESRLVELLRSARRLVISMVAERDDRIIGYLAFSPVTVQRPNAAPGIGLAPLAVLAEYRRRGIGAELVRAGLDVCRAADFGWCVVLGEPEYYGRFGFRPAAGFGLSDEYGGDTAFQAMEFRDGALPRNGGLVRYAEEFTVVA
jgi:putative acetyltransferase